MAAVAAGRRTSFLSIHYLSYVSLRLNKSTGDGIWEKRRKGQLEKYWCMRPWVASDGDDGEEDEAAASSRAITGALDLGLGGTGGRALHSFPFPLN